jgi:hypothetical protein
MLIEVVDASVVAGVIYLLCPTWCFLVKISLGEVDTKEHGKSEHELRY